MIGGRIDAFLKLTCQSGQADETEIQLLAFQQGSTRPVLASVNDTEGKKTINNGAEVKLHSKVVAFNKVEVFQSEPMIGFKFLALTDNDGKPALDLYNFLPVVQGNK